MTARLNDAWTGNLTAAYVYNKFDDVIANAGYQAGGRVPGAPDENASAGLQYRFSLTKGWSGYARADYVFVGDVHYHFGVAPAATDYLQGGYGQTNLRLALQHERLAIELFGRNVTDKRAAEATNDPSQGAYVYLLRPREVGVELRYSFDRSLTR
jgi:outer membrane receptor protein involved in Fe transport